MASSSSSAAAAADKANDAPPSAFWGAGRGSASPPPPPPQRCRQSSMSQRTRGGIVVGEGGDCDSMAYAGAESAGSWRNRTRRWTPAMCLLDHMGGMTTTPSLLLRGIEDQGGGLLLSWSLSSHSVFLPDASPTDGSTKTTTTTATTATTRARRQDDRALEMKAQAHVGSILCQMAEGELGGDCRHDSLSAAAGGGGRGDEDIGHLVGYAVSII